jgi:hypothetical protein
MATFYYAENQVFETKEKALAAVVNMPAAQIWAHASELSFEEFEADFETHGSEALYGGKLVSR